MCLAPLLHGAPSAWGLCCTGPVLAVRRFAVIDVQSRRTDQSICEIAVQVRTLHNRVSVMQRSEARFGIVHSVRCGVNEASKWHVTAKPDNHCDQSRSDKNAAIKGSSSR